MERALRDKTVCGTQRADTGIDGQDEMKNGQTDLNFFDPSTKECVKNSERLQLITLFATTSLGGVAETHRLLYWHTNSHCWCWCHVLGHRCPMPYSVTTHRSPSPNGSARVLQIGKPGSQRPSTTLRDRRPRWQMNGADVPHSFTGTVAVYTAGTGVMYSTTGMGAAWVTAGRVSALSQRTEELAVRPIPFAHEDVSVEGTATSEESTIPLMVSWKAPTTMS